MEAMAQNELIDYVSSQLKIGVAPDEVRKALIGAGWAANDVDEVLRNAKGGGAPASSKSPAASSPVELSPASPASKVFPTTIGGAQGSDQRTIRVSDLVSLNGANGGAGGLGSALPASAAPSKGNFVAGIPAGSLGKAPEKKGSGIFGHRGSDPAGRSAASDPPPLDLASASARAGVMKTKGGKGGRATTVIFMILFLAAGGFAGYLYLQNNDLAAKIASLGGESANVSAQVSSLNDQVAAESASNTALTAETAALSAMNADLLMDLSFVGLPSSTAAGTVTEENATIVGTLSKTKGSYALLTQYGVTAYVKNSSDPAVAAALGPLAGSTTTVTLSGTHVPGSAYITVTDVNGSSVAAAASPAASSTPAPAPSP